MKQLTELQMNDNKRGHGCPYRIWHWHDGGPDFLCGIEGEHNLTCCRNSYDSYFHEAENCPEYLAKMNTEKKCPYSNELVVGKGCPPCFGVRGEQCIDSDNLCVHCQEACDKPLFEFTAYQRECLAAFAKDIINHFDASMDFTDKLFIGGVEDYIDDLEVLWGEVNEECC